MKHFAHALKHFIGQMFVCSLLVVCGQTFAAAKNSTNGYDFDYSVSGDRQVAPSQVFDNNAETYFQFPADKTIPAIFAISPCNKRVLLAPSVKGPYVVVSGLYKKFALQLGVRNGDVAYAGAKDIALEENIANEPSCSPARAGSSSAVYGSVAATATYGVTAPIKGDGNQDLIAKRPSDVNIANKNVRPTTEELRAIASKQIATKIDDTKPAASRVNPEAPPAARASVVQELPKTEIVTGDVRNVATVTTSSPSAVQPAAQEWQLTAGKSVGAELKTWGDKAGWNVVWNNPKDWTIPSSTKYAGEFQTAASEVIQTLAANGALIRANFYEGNKTLVISGPGVTGK